MKKFIGFKKKSPVAAAVVCGILVAVSSLTVCAASAGMAVQYRNFYQASVVEEVETMDIMELEEFEEELPEPALLWKRKVSFRRWFGQQQHLRGL